MTHASDVPSYEIADDNVDRAALVILNRFIHDAPVIPDGADIAALNDHWDGLARGFARMPMDDLDDVLEALTDQANGPDAEPQARAHALALNVWMFRMEGAELRAEWTGGVLPDKL